MKLLITLASVLFASGLLHAQEHLRFEDHFLDRTLRIDFYQTGNAEELSFSIDQLLEEGAWAGNPLRPIDQSGSGMYFARVFDLATNRLLYSRGFATLFGEYRTTTDAKNGLRKSYHQTVRIPYPKSTVLFVIEGRGEHNLLEPIFSARIDPASVNILREAPHRDIEVKEIAVSGPPRSQVDIALVAEGYTAGEREKFWSDAGRFTEVLFRHEPFSSRKSDISVRAVFAPSSESGVDQPRKGIFKNTAVDSAFNALDLDRYLLIDDTRALRDIAGAAPYDHVAVLANSTRYGGGGIFGDYSISTVDHARSEQVFTHEFGHAFANLADEYFSAEVAYNEFFPAGREPHEPNITALLDPKNVKWKHLLTPGIPIPTPWGQDEIEELQARSGALLEEMRAELDRLVEAGESREGLREVRAAYREGLDDIDRQAASIREHYQEEYRGKIGVFEGAGYSPRGLYRSEVHVGMLHEGSFGPVSEEAIGRAIDQLSGGRSAAVIAKPLPAAATVMTANNIDDPLLPNPSFEVVDGDQPVRWEVFRWGGNGDAALTELGRTGKHSVTLSSATGADISWGAIVTVRPFSRYRFRGWIKTENLIATTGRGALFNLHGREGAASPIVTGTHDWTEVSYEFDTEANDSIHLNCLYGGWGFATGTAWFDDLSLELLSTRELAPAVRIDASVEAEPIEPYIYGQFIEHLGRCIYGGIWAEMLEDRKFWYVPGEHASPWSVIGEAGALMMDQESSFVGEHTPVLRGRMAAEHVGLAHGGLGLVAGQGYEGRVVLAGDPSAAPVEVRLVWGDRPGEQGTVTIASISPEYNTSLFRFTAGASTDQGRLEIVASGRGALRIGTASLMPADNVDGFRADVLALLKELDSPIYRWPGGNFVSGYDWKDGIGDPDRRPPRKNPAWTGIEHNDVGIHEFLHFCELLDTEPYVTVNTGLGSVEMCAEEVEYANGGLDTPMGALRAENGHPDPYGVVWWAIGNEMYGGWQLGNMPLEQYVLKHNAVVEAMRAIDPTIRAVAVGAVGRWDELMMARCADHMDLVSEHFYCGERPGLMGHAAAPAEQVKRIADAHRRYREEVDGLKGKGIRIALDEWNFWYGPHLYGELGTRYFLKDALGIARGLHEYFRNSDIYFMANYAQTVNVIGAIKATKTAAAFAATGQVLKLYRNRFGSIPVEVGGAPEPLDVVAAWNESRDRLTFAVVNPTVEEVMLDLAIDGVELTGEGTRWLITGPHPGAYNEPGGRMEVEIEEVAVRGLDGKLAVPAMSVTLYELVAR